MNSRTLSVYYQNCRGMRTKLHTIYVNILLNDYDIIILSETWLHSDIQNGEWIDSRYCVHRCDRDRGRSGKRDGGGVLVAVRRELGVVPRVLDADASATAVRLSPLVNHVLVELRARDYCCVVVAAYIPPNLNSEDYITFLEYITYILQCEKVDSFI